MNRENFRDADPGSKKRLTRNGRRGLRRIALKGFTLLEMLAAMSMIAVLAGSLYTSLNIGFRTKRECELALARINAVIPVFEVISRDLSGAPPPRSILAGPFFGEPDSLSFFTRPMSTTEAAPGIAAIAYALTPSENGETGSVLTRYITVNLLSPEETEPIEERLCYGVRSTIFRYFDGTVWLDTWDSITMGDRLPVAVEITMETATPADARGGTETDTFRRVFLLPCAVPDTGETEVA